MDINPHYRRSMRLQGYDYSQIGAYFITVVTQGRRCLFGEVTHGEMQLTPAGLMVERVWMEIPEHYPGIFVDAFVVMPNHVHGIIMIDDLVGAPPCGCPSQSGQAQGPAPTDKQLSLPDVVHDFKSLTTHRYITGVTQSHWQKFDGRLWQRNYYEHIIRDEHDLQTITDYILANPQNWDMDDENQYPDHHE